MDEKKPYLAVILIQSIYSGMFLLSKAAFNGGMNTFIFLFYRQAFATVFLAPISLFLERKNAPPLSFSTFCKIFMLSLCGITLSLDIYGVALVYTSPTLAAATINILPVITFFLAVLMRMETMKLRTSPGVAKIAGIAICLGGAVTIAFYRGPGLRLLPHQHILGHHSHQGQDPSSKTWIKGVFLMLTSNTLWSLWLVLQGHVIKAYPSKLLFTTMLCFLSTVQAFVIAIAVERDPYEWKLGWNVRLLSVAYCGVVVTGVTFYLQTWVIEKKGPVFLATSTPLALILTILCSFFLIREMITLGSVLGGILLVGGLYCVLWGKSKEQKVDADIYARREEAEKESLDTTEAMETKCPSQSLV